MNGTVEEYRIVNDSFAARCLRIVTPGWGWCYNCGVPWPYVDHHTTWWSERDGCFPLCTTCWDTLGAEAKLHCYRVYVEDTEQLDDWSAIAAALAAELGHGKPRPNQQETA